MCEIDWNASAAWVQAVGSILAILVAIWLGERSARQSRDLVDNERKRQAAIAASSIAARFRMLSDQLKHQVSVSREIIDSETLPTEVIAIVESFVKLREPELFIAYREYAKYFDLETGIAVNKTLDMIENQNNGIDGDLAIAEFHLASAREVEVRAILNQLWSRLSQTSSSVDLTMKRLENIYA